MRFKNNWGIYVARLSENTYNAIVLGFTGPDDQDGDAVFGNPLCDLGLSAKTKEQIGRTIIELKRMAPYAPKDLDVETPTPHALKDEGHLLDLDSLFDKPPEVVVPDYYSSSYFESDYEEYFDEDVPTNDWWY